MSADNTVANVYIIQCKPRKYRTRNSFIEGMPVSFNIHGYESEEGSVDEDEVESEEEN